MEIPNLTVSENNRYTVFKFQGGQTVGSNHLSCPGKFLSLMCVNSDTGTSVCMKVGDFSATIPCNRLIFPLPLFAVRYTVVEFILEKDREYEFVCTNEDVHVAVCFLKKKDEIFNWSVTGSGSVHGLFTLTGGRMWRMFAEDETCSGKGCWCFKTPVAIMFFNMVNIETFAYSKYTMVNYPK